MGKRTTKSVDDYIAAQTEEVRAILDSVRRAIRKAAPAAEESISYDIPTYKIKGERLIYFAAWKHHYSLYPVTERDLAECVAATDSFDIRKSTIRFSYDAPVPAKLIERITKHRLRQISA